MIVGQSLINEAELAKHLSSYEEFCNYCDNLIPNGYRHRIDISMNQRYYCALLIRKNKYITWDIKKDLINTIMANNKVTGFTNSVIDVSLLSSFIDERRMMRYDRRFRSEQC